MTTTPDPEQLPQQTPQQPQSPQGQQPQETPQPHLPPQPSTAPAQAAQPVQHTQPTVPLPDTASQQPHAPQYSSPQYHAFGAQPQQQAPQAPHALQTPQQPQAATATAAHATATHPAASSEPSQRKSRAGVLFAGIAIGALVGGIIGGGASALVATNLQPSPVVQSQAGGRVTLNNLETATSVSGVAAAAIPSVVTLEVSGRSAAGSGSGVIYNDEGYIVTNAHVVTLDGEAGSNPEIRVWLSDGRILDGELIGTDPFADLAVVKVEADDLVPIELADSSQVNVGDLAVAIGAPLNLSNTVTSGVVSALNRGIEVGSPIIPDEQDDQSDQGDDPGYRFGDPNEGQDQRQSQASSTRVTLPVVQTDASINPGNSGGALLNANAELIGINVAIASNGSDASTAGSDGLGFAIPVNMVTRVVDSLIAGERPSHGLLGIGVNDSAADTDADRNFAGGLISEITRGGPADEGGLKVGDVITAVDGIPADSGTSVSALIRMHEGGDEVTISYSRGGEPGEATVTLGTLEW